MPPVDSRAHLLEKSDRPADTSPIETARLRLEPLDPRFAPSIQRNIDTWEIIRFLSNVPWPYPSDGASTWISSFLERERNGEGLGWAVTRKEAPTEAIGAITFERKDTVWTRGFWLAVAHQSNGYMSEGVRAATDYAFDHAGIDRLEIPTYVGNLGSSRIKEKMAGTLLRTEPIPNPRPGSEFVNQEVWEITAGAWRAWRRDSKS